MLERYRNIINSIAAKRVSKPKSCAFIYLKLLASIAKKLSPTSFKDLNAVANPNIVKMLDKRTVIPKDFILMASDPKIPIIGRANNMLIPI